MNTHKAYLNVDGLVQERRNFSALAMESRLLALTHRYMICLNSRFVMSSVVMYQYLKLYDIAYNRYPENVEKQIIGLWVISLILWWHDFKCITSIIITAYNIRSVRCLIKS